MRGNGVFPGKKPRQGGRTEGGYPGQVKKEKALIVDHQNPSTGRGWRVGKKKHIREAPKFRKILR